MKKHSSQLQPTELSPKLVIFMVSSLEMTEESVDHVNVHGRLASFLEYCHFFVGAQTEQVTTGASVIGIQTEEFTTGASVVGAQTE
ncbi:hypothetical protein LWI28_025820 [Acer negundo]|uniref:Uncharacterized protein n=1 Tax=Acer negundo TaxID=4023 RepID=A0AAD5IKL8_ACENE|nr:hypothetical protein LWI28_025820 [Acer negundo]